VGLESRIDPKTRSHAVDARAAFCVAPDHRKRLEKTK
jgi:hypothetical protein